MKKLITLFVSVVLFSIAGISQNMYWSVYHFEVEAGQEASVSAAFDQIFDSEIGKTLPYAVLAAPVFNSSRDKWTHEVLFASPDKAGLDALYSGKLQLTKDFALFAQVMNSSTEGVAVYLGKSLIAEPVPGNIWSTVYEMSVSDPGKYAEAFNKMRTAMRAATDGKMGLDLHQLLSGNEKGATHVAVATAASFADLLEYTDMLFASSEYASFAGEVKDIRTILRVFTTRNLKEYNVPGGM